MSWGMGHRQHWQWPKKIINADLRLLIALLICTCTLDHLPGGSSLAPTPWSPFLELLLPSPPFNILMPCIVILPHLKFFKPLLLHTYQSFVAMSLQIILAWVTYLSLCLELPTNNTNKNNSPHKLIIISCDCFCTHCIS